MYKNKTIGRSLEYNASYVPSSFIPNRDYYQINSINKFVVLTKADVTQNAKGKYENTVYYIF